MKVTSKGQVTIPKAVREKLGIGPNTEIEFVEGPNGRFYLLKTRPSCGNPSRFRSASTVARLKMSTDEIMALTRGD